MHSKSHFHCAIHIRNDTPISRMERPNGFGPSALTLARAYLLAIRKLILIHRFAPIAMPLQPFHSRQLPPTVTTRGQNRSTLRFEMARTPWPSTVTARLIAVRWRKPTGLNSDIWLACSRRRRPHPIQHWAKIVTDQNGRKSLLFTILRRPLPRLYENSIPFMRGS